MDAQSAPLLSPAGGGGLLQQAGGGKNLKYHEQ